jgi:hypothetical protein
MSDHTKSIAEALEILGDPAEWKMPDGYKNSLALCVMDSIWSIGIKYQTVVRVLDRYLEQRGFGGIRDAQKCADGPSDFLEWVKSLNAHEKAADEVSLRLKNGNKTSSAHNAVLKSEAVIQACQILQSMNVESTFDLISRIDEVKPHWLYEVPGQRSGISWRYLLMLSGSPGVKPDRMVLRFLERIGVDASIVTAEDFVEIIVQKINLPHINATAVDHRIWSVERESAQ